mgnify:FL=1
MSLEDFRQGVTYRVVQDARLTNSILAIVDGRKALNAERKATTLCQQQRANDRIAIDGLRQENDGLRDSLQKANRKIKRRNPFTPMLIGVVGGIIIHQSIQ